MPNDHEDPYDDEEGRARPDRDKAEAAVSAFLKEMLGEEPSFRMIEDGEYGWAFWILEDDTTSYVHPDLKIEWYGTSWEPGADRECEGDADPGQECGTPR